MSIIIPKDAWLAVTPVVFSKEGARTPELYVQCIEQFHVEVEGRYQRDAKGFTKCNIFAQDVVGDAMKAPCPHWVDKTTRDPLPMGANGLPIQKMNRDELGGNGICEWLQTVGIQRYGWRRVTPQEACVEASRGHPTLVTWFNAGPDGKPHTIDDGTGHIGIIRPSTFPIIRMAQAGGSNFVNGTVGNGFGNDPKRNAQLVYVTHD